MQGVIVTSPYGESNGNDGDLPRYQPTNHPEDNPNYGYQGGGQSGYQGYEQGHQGYQDQQGYQGYEQAGYAGYAAGNSGAVQGVTMPASGAVDFMEAIRWGFKTTFRNAGLWILGAFAFGLVFLIISIGYGVMVGFSADGAADTSAGVSAGTLLLDLVMMIIGLVATPVLYRLALQQIDDPRAGWKDVGRDVHFGITIAVCLVLQVLATIVVAIVMAGPLIAMVGSMANAAGVDEAAATALGLAFLLVAIVVLAALFVTPLYMLITWFPADGRTGFGESFSQGFKAGRKHYLPLLGFNVVWGIIYFVAIAITLGLGAIVVIPAGLLAQAHVYRQAAGGPVPVPEGSA